MKIRGSLILAVGAARSSMPALVLAQTSRPNIVFILADNLGYGEAGAFVTLARFGGAKVRSDRPFDSFERSVKQHPLIPTGTRDPYRPGAAAR